MHIPTNAFECSSFGEGNILFSIFQDDAGHSASFCLDCIFLSVLFSLCAIPTKFIFWKPVVIKLYLDLCVRFCLIYLMAKIKQFYLQDEPLTCRADIIGQAFPHVGALGLEKIIAVYKYLCQSQLPPVLGTISLLGCRSHQSLVIMLLHSSSQRVTCAFSPAFFPLMMVLF